MRFSITFAWLPNLPIHAAPVVSGRLSRPERPLARSLALSRGSLPPLSLILCWRITMRFACLGYRTVKELTHMPSFIPKQPKKDRDQITINLDRDVLQNLERYCRYLDSSRDYVINQCLAFSFAKTSHSQCGRRARASAKH